RASLRVKLDGGSEDIGKAFIERSAFVGISKAGSIGDYAVRDLMAADVDGGQRAVAVSRAAVAVGHAGAVPESVEVIHAVVHVTLDRIAGIIDAVTAERVLVVIIGHLCAPVRVGGKLILGGVGVIPVVVSI